jgi:UDP-N-acetylglucosamine acyltransferase
VDDFRPGIDERAVIHDGARLGEGVAVGPFAVIGEGVRLGDGVKIGAHVVVGGDTEIGRETRVYPFSSIGLASQDTKYGGEPTRVTLGARNVIREYTTVHRGTVGGGGLTSVGDDNYLMAYTHIAHDCHVADHTIFANAATLAGHVEVASHATVGAFSGVHQFCRVGPHAFIGGYSVVTRDALPYCLTVGNRAECHGVNRIGLQRLGFSKDTILAIKRCYKTVFRSGLTQAEGLTEAEAQLGEVPEVKIFIDFVRGTKRGVIG